MREERERREKEEKERNAYSSLYSSMASKYDDEDDDDEGFSGSISKLMSDSSATRRAARSRVSQREKSQKIKTYLREDDKISSRLR